jgi:branched-subunit amino acid aminotransferase/4-amino-4-deoxychorismate lyase
VRATQAGDACWEGLRVYGGRVFALDAHLARLINSAKALKFDDIPTLAFIESAIFATLAANKMRDGVHIRLTLTRGEKVRAVACACTCVECVPVSVTTVAIARLCVVSACLVR